MIFEPLFIFLTPIYLIMVDVLAIIGAFTTCAKLHIDLTLGFWPFLMFLLIFIIGTGSVLLTIAIWEILLKEIKLN